MKLQDYGLLADENVHPEVVGYLRSRGSDVLAVCESGLIGSEDQFLLQFALAENRVLITHDADFGALAVARLEPVVGIVYLRPGHIDPRFTIETLRALFDRNLDLTPPFILVAKRTAQTVTVRVRNL